MGFRSPIEKGLSEEDMSVFKCTLNTVSEYVLDNSELNGGTLNDLAIFAEFIKDDIPRPMYMILSELNTIEIIYNKNRRGDKEYPLFCYVYQYVCKMWSKYRESFDKIGGEHAILGVFCPGHAMYMLISRMGDGTVTWNFCNSGRFSNLIIKDASNLEVCPDYVCGITPFEMSGKWPSSFEDASDVSKFGKEIEFCEMALSIASLTYPPHLEKLVDIIFDGFVPYANDLLNIVKKEPWRIQQEQLSGSCLTRGIDLAAKAITNLDSSLENSMLSDLFQDLVCVSSSKTVDRILEISMSDQNKNRNFDVWAARILREISLGCGRIHDEFYKEGRFHKLEELKSVSIRAYKKSANLIEHSRKNPPPEQLIGDDSSTFDVEMNNFHQSFLIGSKVIQMKQAGEDPTIKFTHQNEVDFPQYDLSLLFRWNFIYKSVESVALYIKYSYDEKKDKEEYYIESVVFYDKNKNRLETDIFFPVFAEKWIVGFAAVTDQLIIKRVSNDSGEIFEDFTTSQMVSIKSTFVSRAIKLCEDLLASRFGERQLKSLPPFIANYDGIFFTSLDSETYMILQQQRHYMLKNKNYISDKLKDMDMEMKSLFNSKLPSESKQNPEEWKRQFGTESKTVILINSIPKLCFSDTLRILRMSDMDILQFAKPLLEIVRYDLFCKQRMYSSALVDLKRIADKLTNKLESLLLTVPSSLIQDSEFEEIVITNTFHLINLCEWAVEFFVLEGSRPDCAHRIIDLVARFSKSIQWNDYTGLFFKEYIVSTLQFRLGGACCFMGTVCMQYFPEYHYKEILETAGRLLVLSSLNFSENLVRDQEEEIREYVKEENKKIPQKDMQEFEDESILLMHRKDVITYNALKQIFALNQRGDTVQMNTIFNSLCKGILSTLNMPVDQYEMQVFEKHFYEKSFSNGKRVYTKTPTSRFCVVLVDKKDEDNILFYWNTQEAVLSNVFEAYGHVWEQKNLDFDGHKIRWELRELVNHPYTPISVHFNGLKNEMFIFSSIFKHIYAVLKESNSIFSNGYISMIMSIPTSFADMYSWSWKHTSSTNIVKGTIKDEKLVWIPKSHHCLELDFGYDNEDPPKMNPKAFVKEKTQRTLPSFQYMNAVSFSNSFHSKYSLYSIIYCASQLEKWSVYRDWGASFENEHHISLWKSMDGKYLYAIMSSIHATLIYSTEEDNIKIVREGDTSFEQCDVKILTKPPLERIHPIISEGVFEWPGLWTSEGTFLFSKKGTTLKGDIKTLPLEKPINVYSIPGGKIYEATLDAAGFLVFEDVDVSTSLAITSLVSHEPRLCAEACFSGISLDEIEQRKLMILFEETWSSSGETAAALLNIANANGTKGNGVISVLNQVLRKKLIAAPPDILPFYVDISGRHLVLTGNNYFTGNLYGSFKDNIKFYNSSKDPPDKIPHNGVEIFSPPHKSVSAQSISTELPGKIVKFFIKIILNESLKMNIDLNKVDESMSKWLNAMVQRTSRPDQKNKKVIFDTPIEYLWKNSPAKTDFPSFSSLPKVKIPFPPPLEFLEQNHKDNIQEVHRQLKTYVNQVYEAAGTYRTQTFKISESIIDRILGKAPFNHPNNIRSELVRNKDYTYRRLSVALKLCSKINFTLRLLRPDSTGDVYISHSIIKGFKSSPVSEEDVLPGVISVEVVRGFFATSKQVNMIRDMVNTALSKEDGKKNGLWELIMGEGKSSVIAPSVSAQLCSFHDLIVLSVVPNHMIKNAINLSRPSTSRVSPISFNSGVWKNGFENKNDTLEILSANAQNCSRGLVITKDTVIKIQSIECGFIKFNRHRFAALIDEYDLLIEPLSSELNVPSVKEKDLSMSTKLEFLFSSMHVFLKALQYEKDPARFNTEGTRENFKSTESLKSILKTIPSNVFQRVPTLYIRDPNSFSEHTIPAILKTISKIPSDKQLGGVSPTYFLENTLIPALTLTHRVDFGTVPDLFTQGDSGPVHVMEAIPFSAKDSPLRTSRFSDIGVRMGTSCISRLLPGVLPYEDAKELASFIQKTLQENPNEIKVRIAIHELFYEWTLKDIRNSDVSTLVNHFYKPGLRMVVIRYFIIFVLNDQLSIVNPQKKTSNGISVYGLPFLCDHRIGFTGTPSALRVGWYKDENDPTDISMPEAIQDEETQIRIRKGLRNPEINRSLVRFKPENQNVDYYVQQIIKEINENDVPLVAFIDAGAMILSISNEEFVCTLAKTFYSNNISRNIDAVLFIDEEEGVLQGKTCEENPKPVHDVNYLTPERTFMYFDHAHITGVDVVLKKKSAGILTVSRHTSYRDASQAAFRLRQLGKPEGQTIKTWVPSDLHPSTETPKEFMDHLEKESFKYEHMKFPLLYRQASQGTLLFEGPGKKLPSYSNDLVLSKDLKKQVDDAKDISTQVNRRIELYKSNIETFEEKELDREESMYDDFMRDAQNRNTVREQEVEASQETSTNFQVSTQRKKQLLRLYSMVVAPEMGQYDADSGVSWFMLGLGLELFGKEMGIINAKECGWRMPLMIKQVMDQPSLQTPHSTLVPLFIDTLCINPDKDSEKIFHSYVCIFTSKATPQSMEIVLLSEQSIVNLAKGDKEELEGYKKKTDTQVVLLVLDIYSLDLVSGMKYGGELITREEAMKILDNIYAHHDWDIWTSFDILKSEFSPVVPESTQLLHGMDSVKENTKSKLIRKLSARSVENSWCSILYKYNIQNLKPTDIQLASYYILNRLYENPSGELVSTNLLERLYGFKFENGVLLDEIAQDFLQRFINIVDINIDLPRKSEMFSDMYRSLAQLAITLALKDVGYGFNMLAPQFITPMKEGIDSLLCSSRNGIEYSLSQLNEDRNKLISCIPIRPLDIVVHAYSSEPFSVLSHISSKQAVNALGGKLENSQRIEINESSREFFSGCGKLHSAFEKLIHQINKLTSTIYGLDKIFRGVKLVGLPSRLRISHPTLVTVDSSPVRGSKIKIEVDRTDNHPLFAGTEQEQFTKGTKSICTMVYGPDIKDTNHFFVISLKKKADVYPNQNQIKYSILFVASTWNVAMSILASLPQLDSLDIPSITPKHDRILLGYNNQYEIFKIPTQKVEICNSDELSIEYMEQSMKRIYNRRTEYIEFATDYGASALQVYKEREIDNLVHQISPEKAVLIHNAVKEYPNLKEYLGHALVKYIRVGDQKQAIKFIKIGANVNLKDGYPLQLACTIGSFEIVQSLIEHGADTNSKNGKALYLTVSKSNRTDIAKLLLDHGADPNQKGKELLFIAVYYNNVEMVKLLANYGVDIKTNKHDLIILASKQENDNIAKFLAEW